MFGSTESDVISQITQAILSLARRIENLEALDQVTISIKTTTGNPATGKTGLISVNIFDNKAFIYGDGAWRQIASW